MRRFNLFLVFPALFILFNTFLFAQTNVEASIKKLLNDSSLKNASLGLCVLNANTGEMVYNHNGMQSLKPASTLKVITTSTALGVLGGDFQFETVIEYTGTIDGSGTLNGDLYLRGGGDPSLGFLRYDLKNPKMKELMNIFKNKISAAGIKKVNGNVIGDASIFSSNTVPKKWIWEDIGNYYGAGSCGLNLHENQYNIQFKVGATVGSSTEIDIVYPDLSDVEFINEVKTGSKSSGDQAYIFAAPFSDKVYVRGTVPAGNRDFTIKGAVPDPARFAANNLKKQLEDSGIAVSGLSLSQYEKNNEAKTEVYSHKSPKLENLIFWANKKSINLYCEAILKMIGLKLYGAGSTHNGIKGVIQYWKNRGVDLDGFYIHDGSGLSPDNAVSTFQLAKILQKTTKENYYETFNKSLSFAGDPNDRGSLRSQLTETKAAKNLRAKSGYISRVRSYSGYVQNSCGELLSFSIIVNNYNCSNSSMKKKLMSVLKTLAEMQ